MSTGCLANAGFRQNNVSGLYVYYLRYYIFTVYVHVSSNYIKAVSIRPKFTHSVLHNY